MVRVGATATLTCDSWPETEWRPGSEEYGDAGSLAGGMGKSHESKALAARPGGAIGVPARSRVSPAVGSSNESENRPGRRRRRGTVTPVHSSKLFDVVLNSFETCADCAACGVSAFLVFIWRNRCAIAKAERDVGLIDVEGAASSKSCLMVVQAAVSLAAGTERLAMSIAFSGGPVYRPIEASNRVSSSSVHVGIPATAKGRESDQQLEPAPGSEEERTHLRVCASQEAPE